MKIALAFAALLALAPAAHANCKCMAVAGDVTASVTAEVAKADGLYARGDFSGALALYTKTYATSKDAVLLYAQGMCEWQLGVNDKAKGFFDAYLKAGGTLAYRDRAEAGLHDLGVGVAATVGGTAAVVSGVGHGALGIGEATVGTTAGVAGGVTADVRAHVDKPQEKIGHKAGIVLGVIAIAAIGVVGIHSITAGVSTEATFDPKFDLGLGAAGVAVGISAIYVAGLGATAAAVPTCAVAPMPLHGGGGVAAALSF